MQDAQTIAENYIAFWNAADPAERRKLFETGWRSDATYADPVMRGVGGEEIGALVGGAQQRFPDFAFRLIGAADGHGDFVRFRWGLGPDGREAPIEGSDVVKLSGGRIAEVIGFLDKLPQ
jgi:SnoaL-like domain